LPHNQSIENQKKFDKYGEGQVLTLDTKTTEKVMYLTFDNGYEYQNLTANILDTLKAKGVKATFFITLSYAKNNKALVQRMINEGHIVGNHSATHPSFPTLSRTEMANDIAKLNDYLIQNFSYTSPYFRFPAGEYSESALDLVSSIGYKSVFWSVAYSDWNTGAQKGADYAYQTVTSRFHSGAVILLHAVSKDNADALGRIIDTARNSGYTFKTLDDYFKK
jgi:peptidoglycan-N-acetylmuramic acid deacetylase